MDSTMSPKVMIVKRDRVGVHSLACNILGVEGRFSAPEWGLGRLTSKSILTWTYTKPNNKLVHNWNTFDAWTNHAQTQIHKTHHDSNLGEATTFPLIVFLCLDTGLTPKCHFVSGLQLGSPKIPKIWTPATLEAHNFMCKPLIKVKFKVGEV